MADEPKLSHVIVRGIVTVFTNKYAITAWTILFLLWYFEWTPEDIATIVRSIPGLPLP